MNILNIQINSNEYLLYIIDHINYSSYEHTLDKIKICDENIISDSYESLSYKSLQFEGYIGYFLSNTEKTTIYTSAIIDLNCSQIRDKIPSYDFNYSFEIVLLCSNVMSRVKGLTSFLMKKIINYFIHNGTYEHIYLYVA